MGWKPIETAPRDGRPVDLWIASTENNEDAADVDFYTNGMAAFNPKTRRREGRVTDMCWERRAPNSPGWYSVGGLPGMAMQATPTHWMFAPDPPEDQS